MPKRTTPRQLSPRRVQDRLKQVEKILDEDPTKLSEDQRIEYLTLFAKLAKLLSDGDRVAAIKSSGGIFR